MGAIHLKAEDFDREVLQSSIPVLVDFYAEWCGPCKMLTPIINGVADEMQGQIKVCKINVDEAQDIASHYNVMSIPNLVFFNNGQAVDQTVGVVSKELLIQKVKATLL